MKNFIFKTTTTIKKYNNKKWWIDSDIVPEIRIKAETLKEALLEYQKRVYENSYIEISKNALKTKKGYVCRYFGRNKTGWICYHWKI